MLRGALLRLIAALLLAGCSQRSSFFIDREEAESLIVAKETGGGWTLDAKEIRSEDPAELESPDPIYVLLYDDSLAELELISGPLSQEMNGRLLPEPDRRFLVDDTGPMELGELPDSLAAVRIARPDPCYEIEQTGEGSFAGATSLFFTTEIGERHLISTNAGFFWADAEAIVPASELTPDLPREAGFWHGATGELWLIDSATGRAVHGDSVSGFTLAPDLPNTDRTPIFMDGSRDETLELFVLTSSRALYRFDGSAWEERAPPRGLGPYSSRHQIAWRAPRQAVALSRVVDRVLEDDGRTVSEVFVPELNTGATDDSLQTVSYVEGYGPMLATDRGALYRAISPGWQLLHRAPTRTQAWIIEPIGSEGVIYGGEDGVVAQYQPGASCASFLLAPQADVPLIAWLATGEVRTAIYPAAGALLWIRAELR